MMAPFEIKWTAPEFEYHAKGVSWYWISIIIAVVILGLAVWQKNFLFGLFVVIAEVLVLSWSVREPRSLDFVLSEKGLDINKNAFYAYNEIEKFSVEASDADWPSLVFYFRRKLRPTVKIKIPKDLRTPIEKTLKTILPQVEYELSLLDSVEEFIGF